MNWWQQLKKNNLARLGSIILITLYLLSFTAEFVAPYSPFESQKDGSLLPPTAIYFNNPEGVFLGPHVYPVTQGKTDINTGDRALKTDFKKPSPIRFFVQGDPYPLLRVAIPSLDTSPAKGKASNQDTVIFSGFTSKLHLFGAEGEGKVNLLGTDEQGRDQFSRLLYGSRVSLFVGLIGILISFPIGTFVGGIAGYFGGWVDAILMRIVEVLMTIPTLYLLVAIAGILPAGISSS
jgi:peptide/nickel transport system permease protein